MKDSDIEFSVGLNISPAEQRINDLNKTLSGGNTLEFSNKIEDALNRINQKINGKVNDITGKLSSGIEKRLSPVNGILNKGFGFVNDFSINKAAGITTTYSVFKNEFKTSLSQFKKDLGISSAMEKVKNIGINSYAEAQTANFVIRDKLSQFGKDIGLDFVTTKGKQGLTKLGNGAKGAFGTFMDIMFPRIPNSQSVSTEEKIEKTEEKTNEENKGVTEEIKKQHRGLLGNLANWLKIYAVIRLVHRAINTAINLWKGFGNVSSETFNITRDQAGNFFADPVGTMRSGIDFTRARIRAGLKAWASSGSPLLNVDAIDTASASLVSVANRAMSGNEVDKNKAIAARAMFDTLGTILNSEMILTGNTQGYSYTDLVVDLMDKFETFMSDPKKWKSLGTVKQNQFMQYLRELLGEDIPNAVVQNVNLNQQMKDPSSKKTLLEHILGVSDSVNTFGNVGQNATLASESLAAFNDALSGLKRTLVNQYTPQFVAATGLLIKGIKKLQGIIDEDEDENSFLAKARNNKFRKKYFTGGEAQNDIPTVSSPKTVNDLINFTMAGIPSFDETTLEAIQNEKYVNAMFDYITSGTTGYSDFKESFPEEKDMRENLKKFYEKEHGKIRLGRSEEIYKTAKESMNGIHKGYASNQEKARAEADMRIYNTWRGKKFLELALSGVELLPSDKEKALQYFIESGIWQVYSRDAFGPQTTPYWSNGKTVGGKFAYNGENVVDYLFDSRFYGDTTEQMEDIRNFFKELSLKTPAFSNYQDVKWTDTNKNFKIEPGELHIELSIDGQPKTYDLNTVINGSIR